MLLRFESPNGQFRLTVEPTDTFDSLTSKASSPRGKVRYMLLLITEAVPQILDRLPPKTDVSTITLSNKPVGHRMGEERLLCSLPGVRIQQVGLSWVTAGSSPCALADLVLVMATSST